MKNIYFIMLAICLFPMNTWGQCLIKGRILNQEQQAIDAANIQLIKSDSILISGSISDAKGKFIIDGIASGVYKLRVSHIEYESYTSVIDVSNEIINLNDICLLKANNTLSEVQVVAAHIMKRKDGMLIYPRKQDLKFAGTGYDVIYNLMIPGIVVDKNKGSVTRLGKEVSLYIDGQKAAYREIQNINPSSISKIEYIDTPSGKYLQDDIVINVITQKKVDSYYAFDAKQTLGYLQGDYNVTAQFVRNKSSYHFFMGYNMSNYENVGTEKNEFYTFQLQNIERKSETTEDKNTQHNQYLQFNWKTAREKVNWGAKFSFIHLLKPDCINKQVIDYSPSLENATSISEVREESYSPVLEIYSDWGLKNNQKLNINLRNTYSKNTYSRTFQENDFRIHNRVKENFYNGTVDLNYTLPIQQNMLSVSFIDNFRTSHSLYMEERDWQQNLYTNEAILFAGYFHTFNSQWMVNARLGASLLNYHLEGENHVSQFSPRANIMLRYSPLQKHAFSLQFNTGNSFPMIDMLNDVVQPVNEYLVKKGNPDLKTSHLYNTAFMYNLFCGKINFQVMLINNIFVNMAVPCFYTENNKIVNSYMDNTTLKQYIGVFSGAWSITKSLNIKTELACLNISFCKSITKEETTLRAMFDMNYSWKDFMINLFVRVKEKRLTNAAITEKDFTNYGGSIRWSKSNWYIEIGTNSPFQKKNSVTQNFSTPVYSYETRNYDRSFQQAGYVKFIYHFNKGKKQNVENKTINMGTESAIMRAE